MNLADAIRQAALRQAEEQGHKEPTMASNPFFNADEAQASTPAEDRTEGWTDGKAEESVQIHPVFQTSPQIEPDTVEDLAEVEETSNPPTFQSPTQSEAPNSPQFSIEASNEEPPTWGSDTGKLTITTDPEHATELFASDSATGEPVALPEAAPGLGSGNVVRFEIFLSPEQLSCLFRALVATQHSMMTLREAAAYLRIPATTLEQLATESKIPALQLEGRWRFPKSGIDEWVMLQSFRDGEVNDAA